MTAAQAPRILVVDDDRLVLATLAHGLASAGFEVLDADNGDDAILLARQHRPDLALLDIRMEGKSGFDVAAYLRSSVGTPFMFLSAFADEQTLEQVRALGAVAYLIKPLDMAQIVPAVRMALAQVQGQAQTSAPAVSSPAQVSPAGTGTPAAVAPSFDEVSMAMGVLMHRYSLNRHAAWTRLQEQARAQGRSEAAQARRILDAVETLGGD